MMRSKNERVEIPSLKICLDVSSIENNGDNGSDRKSGCERDIPSGKLT
jgi:hypothetical protein